MEPDLLERFDRDIAASGYPCRSEAIRDLVRERLARTRLQAGHAEAVGTITLVFDHDRPGLTHRITHTQHAHAAEIVSTTHIHLDRRNCLEVLVVRGRTDRLRQLADALGAIKGVKHGQLSLTSPEPTRNTGQ